MRLAAQYKGGFYPTPDRVIDLVAGLVHVPSSYYGCRETVRILDPCCGAGDALARLADRLGEPGAVPVETFGVELHAERAEQARERLDRTLAVDLFSTSIANGAFGVLLLNPLRPRWRNEAGRTSFPGAHHPVPGGGRPAHPHRSPQSPRRLGAVPGIPLPKDQVLGVPRARARGLRPGRPDGYRRAEPLPDPHAEEQIREWADGEPETLSPYRYPFYTAATTPAGDILFATRTVDPVAAAAEARRSGLWTSPEITDSLWPTGDLRTRPLMPLRRGHMAMLVAAGFLDNLCLESDGQRILVKGRTSKEFVLVEDTEDKETYRERLRTTVVSLDLGDGQITDIAA